MNPGIHEAILRFGSQRLLGEYLGITQSQVSKYLHGQARVPVRIVLRFEAELGIPRGRTRREA